MSHNPRRVCPAGRLMRKDQAPTCARCGVTLWRAVWPPRSYESWDTHDERGKRLGYAVTHRRGNDEDRTVPICWNGKSCVKRAKESAHV